MVPGRLDIEIHEHETWELCLGVDDAAGVPLDLTGYGARFLVGRHGVSAPVIDITEASGIALETTQAGAETVNVRLSLTATQTAALAGSYVYELWLHPPQGGAWPVLEGAAKVNRSLLP